jgi:hypothetical protein
MTDYLPYAVEIYRILFENKDLHSVVYFGYGRTSRPAGTCPDTCRALSNDERDGIYHARAI